MKNWNWKNLLIIGMAATVLAILGIGTVSYIVTYQKGVRGWNLAAQFKEQLDSCQNQLPLPGTAENPVQSEIHTLEMGETKDMGCEVYFPWTDATNPTEYAPPIARRACQSENFLSPESITNEKVGGTYTVVGKLYAFSEVVASGKNGQIVLGERTFSINETPEGDWIALLVELDPDKRYPEKRHTDALEIGKTFEVTFEVTKRAVTWGDPWNGQSNYRQFIFLWGNAISIVPVEE